MATSLFDQLKAWLLKVKKNIPKDLESTVKQLQGLKVDNSIDSLTKELHKLGKQDTDLAFQIFTRLFPGQSSDKTKQNVKNALQPKSFKNLTSSINQAVQEGKTIKAVGTHHSLEWTDIGKGNDSNGLTIDMSQLNDVVYINRDVLIDKYKKKLDERMICCFEAGATMENVQEYLWPLGFRTTKYPERYRVLENQTGCVKLSLSGTIATGAHGNGLTKPIIADMVLSFCLLTVDNEGEVVSNQIEPSDGITDPVAFKSIYPKRKLIQDNKTFRAALVNIGGMGIAYSYILSTEKAFYLTENRRIVEWEKAKEEITKLYQRNIDEIAGEQGALHSFEIFINPYPVYEKSPIYVVICTLEYSHGLPSGKRPDWNIIPQHWLRESFIFACNNFPEIVPTLIDILMWGTTTKSPVTMNAVEALDPLSGLAISGEVTVSECAMETQKPSDVIDKIQALINLYQSIRDNDKTQLATCPFAVRFSKQTNAYMAMQYNRQSMMIISNILVGTPNAANTLQQFRNLMRTKFNGRPHWGMVQNLDANDVGQIYPTNNVVDPVDAFINVMQQLDPKEKFRNQFINRVFFPVPNQ